jgi:hypothetical protein
MSFELPGNSGIDTGGRERTLARLHERREELLTALEEENSKSPGESDETKFATLQGEIARLEAQEAILADLDT